MRFSSAFHSPSHVVQIHKGTRDDQQSHYSPEETFSENEHKVCVVLQMTTNAHPQLKTSMENLAMEVAKLFAQVSHQVDNDLFVKVKNLIQDLIWKLQRKFLRKASVIPS